MASTLNLRERIVEELKKYPEGLSSRHLSQILEVRPEQISPVISKLHAYGTPIEKIGGNRGLRVIWRWKQEKNND